MYGRGNEFLGQAFKNDLIVNKYGIKAKCATPTNPQDNSILERSHHIIAKLINKFDSQKNYIDKDEPWSGILSAKDFSVRSTYHNTLQYIPCQLVLGRDMILNNPLIADWEDIRRHEKK